MAEYNLRKAFLITTGEHWRTPSEELNMNYVRFLEIKLLESKKKAERIDNVEGVIKRFEELSKERDIYFHHDHADGYFIKLSEQGSSPKSRFDVAELIHTKHPDMISAMKAAIEWMEESDAAFKRLLSSF